MTIEVYSGRDTGGQPVTVVGLSKDLGEEIAKAASNFTGAPVGAAKSDTMLTRVAEISLNPTAKRVSPLDLLYTEKSEPESKPRKKSGDKKISLVNKAIIDTMKVFAKEGESDRGLATGIVLEPNDGTDGELNPDTQGDVYSADDIEKAAIHWMASGGSVDLMHSFEEIIDERVDVVETWIARSTFKLGDYDVKPGTWLVTTKWSTDGKYWDAIKSGQLNAYSIGGFGTTEPFEGEQQ